jgi:hypothetical protein
MVKIALTLRSCFDAFIRERLHQLKQNDYSAGQIPRCFAMKANFSRLLREVGRGYLQKVAPFGRIENRKAPVIEDQELT